MYVCVHACMCVCMCMPMCVMQVCCLASCDLNGLCTVIVIVIFRKQCLNVAVDYI